MAFIEIDPAESAKATPLSLHSNRASGMTLDAEERQPFLRYLPICCNAISTVLSPATVTCLDMPRAPSCHATTV